MRASQPRRVWLFTAMVVVLIVTHVFQWQPGREPGSSMLFGFLPWDLAYHLFWMVAATGAVLYMTDVLWSSEDEDW